MQYLTFREAANQFAVSVSAISQWVKKGILEEGPAAGRAKTVTLASVENKLHDNSFVKGVEIAKGSAQLERIRQLEQEVQELKKTLGYVLKEIESLKQHKDSSSDVKIHKVNEKKLEKKGKDASLEKKAQLIIDVNEASIEAFGKNSRCNPFSGRNIDSFSGNLPSRLKKGRRPASIEDVYERIFQINDRENVFLNLSPGNHDLAVNAARVREIKKASR